MFGYSEGGKLHGSFRCAMWRKFAQLSFASLRFARMRSGLTEGFDCLEHHSIAWVPCLRPPLEMNFDGLK